MENRYNLIDEPWIPITGREHASLAAVFSDPSLPMLGGNPVQKIALLKLLLAIAQAAATPVDTAEWREIGPAGVAARCLAYLVRWRERFWLYGERPFLQLPAVEAAKQLPYGALAEWIAEGNTTILTESQAGELPPDAERARRLVCQMALALGGKKADHTLVLSPGYQGKRRSSRPGPAICNTGLLHSFLVGETLQQILWLNLATREQIEASRRFPAGVGTPPWEAMPAGEDDEIARGLRQSLIGRLVPLSRFCLLADNGVHYTEGIVHPDYREGVVDPSVTADFNGKKPRVLWSNPDKRPWRELTALLGFVAQEDRSGMECWQLRIGLDRARDVVDVIGIWSGGLRVRGNAGEQYARGNDDYVSSEVRILASEFGRNWFNRLQQEMNQLDEVANRLKKATVSFFTRHKADGVALAGQATAMFWQLCERDFQNLVDHCGDGIEAAAERHRLRLRFSRHALHAFDRHCPRDTARQLDAWAACRPRFPDYLKEEG